ncbi:MAG: hypothetical protein A2W31_03285 [Planctomycetes bacterium RBG_16_64_10]|nr:MAG: hypothetical protein A2W31_03285 [Planctomycetes bacterium RBG_16_64_10]
MKWVLATGLAVIVTSTMASAQTIFVSSIGTVGGGVGPSDPNLPFSATQVTGAKMNIWAILETGQKLEAQSLNLVAMTPGVIELKGVDVKNPFLESVPPLDVYRWEYVHEPAATANAIDGMAAFQVGNFVDPELPSKFAVGAGIGPGTQSVDAWYDATAGAWLLATVTYDVVGFGATELFLQVGANGFLASDAFSADINVVFGGGDDPALNAESQRGTNSATADAVVYNVQFPGDLNGDSNVNGLDVLPFVNFILSGDYDPNADVNLDGAVNGLDVTPFVDAVLGGVGVTSRSMAVPEPTTLGLVVAAVLALGCYHPQRAGRYQDI